MNEEIPAWAIELIKQVERLNGKLPSHVDWVERNIKDHEMWIIAGASGVMGAVVTIIWQMLN